MLVVQSDADRSTGVEMSHHCRLHLDNRRGKVLINPVMVPVFKYTEVSCKLVR